MLNGLLGLASLTSVTRPFGPAAARINELWWVMFWIAVVVCVVVFVFLGLALIWVPALNVFVTGASLYPQNPGMNPTGPLLALSYFAGEALTSRYFRNPRELLV